MNRNLIFPPVFLVIYYDMEYSVASKISQNIKIKLQVLNSSLWTIIAVKLLKTNKSRQPM